MIGLQDLDEAYGSILALASEYEIAIDGNTLSDDLPGLYAPLRTQFNDTAVTYCLETYIRAELDYWTPGDRGLGRVTATVPRLGAHLRTGFSRLSAQELGQLGKFVQDAALRGYLTYALLMEKPLKVAKYSDPQALYQEWIPVIYSGANAGVGPNLRSILEVVCDSPLQSLMDFFEKRGIKHGLFDDGAKTRQAMAHYPLAGVALRAAEVGNTR